MTGSQGTSVAGMLQVPGRSRGLWRRAGRVGHGRDLSPAAGTRSVPGKPAKCTPARGPLSSGSRVVRAGTALDGEGGWGCWGQGPASEGGLGEGRLGVWIPGHYPRGGAGPDRALSRLSSSLGNKLTLSCFARKGILEHCVPFHGFRERQQSHVLLHFLCALAGTGLSPVSEPRRSCCHRAAWRFPSDLTRVTVRSLVTPHPYDRGLPETTCSLPHLLCG